MRVQVQSYHGHMDGFRFGELYFGDGEQRHYLFDRLNRTVKLWSGVKLGGQLDDCPERTALALQALSNVEPLP